MSIFPEHDSHVSASPVVQSQHLTASQIHDQERYAVVARGLVRNFGHKTAVDHLNLTVRAGEFFGFLGPNGAGKSTTIKMMVGQLRPNEGNVWVGGVDVWSDPLRARAFQQAARGNWGASFAWLGVLTVISIVVLYLWQIFVQRRLATADEGGSVAKSVHHHHTASAVAVQERQAHRARISILPQQVSAVMVKDLKYLWRDPQIKGLLLRSLLSTIFLVIYLLLQNSKGSLAFTELYIPNIVLLSPFTLAYNALGFEQQSLTTLFLFPIEPKHLLWGKNLTLFLLGMIEVLVLSTVIAAFTQGWNLLVPTLTLGLSAIAVMLAVGNVISIFLPQRPRMAVRGFRTTASMSTGQGCLLTVMSLVTLVVILIALLPEGLWRLPVEFLLPMNNELGGEP